MFRCQEWPCHGERNIRLWVRRLRLGPWGHYLLAIWPWASQLWIFTGRTDAETLILWPPDPKSQLIGKDLDAGKDWRWEEKGVTEDEMLGWHHRLNGHELEQTWGESGGQRAWWATVYGISKSQTRLSSWTSPVRYRSAASITIQPCCFPRFWWYYCYTH